MSKICNNEVKYHKTKDGKLIKLSDLELDHLKNIIKWIDRKSKEGLTIFYGGGVDVEDIWYSEEVYYGEEAKQKLNYDDYVNELNRRELNEMRKEEVKCDINIIKDNRIVSDITFATRFLNFLKDIQVNDPMSYEEIEYMRMVAKELLVYQNKTCTDKEEKKYLHRCHNNGI